MKRAAKAATLMVMTLSGDSSWEVIMMRRGKKNIVSLFLSLAVLGSVIVPMRVSAVQTETSAAVVEPVIVYDKYTSEDLEEMFGKYAPTKPGYYFGGWYVGPSETTAIKYGTHKNEIVEAGKVASEPVYVYAKFVPAYMLNVKVQNANELNQYSGNENYKDVIAGYDVNKDEDSKNNTKSSLRMISGIDSTRYKEVGFHVFVNGTRVNKMEKSKYNETVYDKIMANGTSRTAEELFGMPGKLMIAKFINIPYTAWGSSIYVRPYWITFDGIEVRGNGKYIHMEDGILGYVTIPVNVQGLVEPTSGGVVAGELNVSYSTDEMVLVDVKGSNCMLDTVMWDADEENGKIKFIALEKNKGKMKNVIPNNYGASARVTDSADIKNQYESINNLYATLRFAKGTKVPTAGYRLNFDGMEFCNVDENLVSVDMWNVRY